MATRHAPAGALSSGGSPKKESALLRFQGVTKIFGGTKAVDTVSLDAYAGSVHAVTGENGAGKSTLMKMLSGVHIPDGGHITLDGAPFEPKSPKDAQMIGVSTIYQELNLIGNLTVAENLFFGHEPIRAGVINRKALVQKARTLMAEIGLDIDPNMPCAKLSIAEQQFVEIAKGLAFDAKVYIFDEPTAALNTAEAERLFELIHRLRRENKLIFYISHRLDEIFDLSDRIAVMKDGRLSAQFERGETDEAGLIRAMVGRDLGDYFPPHQDRQNAPVKLSARDLQPKAGTPAVSFALHQGEILGLAGLEGQGQRDIIRALVGIEGPVSGEVTLDGVQIDPRAGIVGTVRAGIGFVPEDRKTEGLFLEDSIEKNIALGQCRERRLFSRANCPPDDIVSISQRIRLRAESLVLPVGKLSGGNQQKVMLGRWLVSGVEVLVVEEPTRGVDVGAKAEIYAALRDFCAQGYSIVLTSSEMNEVIGLCDRILVVRGGRIVTEIHGGDADEESILAHAITDQEEFTAQ
ncbi:sugar ABC transporter ATP-binding protein [Paracoccus homiensis]|uniref:Monosaccharide ABC transporter ATP-binding protein, CUT2 family n=1 Tax=Paracoccus homiensis TaxID=364199 RepID=A0A1I0IJU0_9RHOB|nr:sugar ABC transporter ATP-binding protein [Paracoccus homiensis]SET97338.1 monosaccharide ABC transporter ATP-binding protein, CUT2 family [Paracoccus homiensis]